MEWQTDWQNSMVVLYCSWKLLIINFFQHLPDTLSILCVQCVHDATFLYIMQQDAFKNGIWIVFISAMLNLHFIGKTMSKYRSQLLFRSAPIQFCCCSNSAKRVHPYLNSTLPLLDLAPVLSLCKAKEKKIMRNGIKGTHESWLKCYFVILQPPL